MNDIMKFLLLFKKPFKFTIFKIIYTNLYFNVNLIK